MDTVCSNTTDINVHNAFSLSLRFVEKCMINSCTFILVNQFIVLSCTQGPLTLI